MNNEISDKRLIKDFKGITFSNFKKSSAKKELLNTLLNGKIEESCYWCAEYICAGHYIDLWDIIFLFISKYIHLGNPKLPCYIELRLTDFKNILNSGYIGNELSLRNNDKIRKLFAEITTIICLSKKKSSFDCPKIKENDYISFNNSFKLKATNVSYANKIFKKGDPKELFIAINELAYNIINKVKNSNDAYYWFEWILGFETLAKKNKKSISSGRRDFNVLSKFQNDVIWVVWDVILNESYKRNEGIQKVIQSLAELYCIRYSPGSKKKRKFIVYFAISLLTEIVDNNIPIFTNSEPIQAVKNKIDNIYKQIKINEIKPNTDYLFTGLNSGNLEKTIAKLDKMSRLNNIIRSNN